MALRASRASRAGCTCVTLRTGCSARWLASVRAAKIPVSIVADVRRNAVRTSSPRFSIRAIIAGCAVLARSANWASRASWACCAGIAFFARIAFRALRASRACCAGTAFFARIAFRALRAGCARVALRTLRSCVAFIAVIALCAGVALAAFKFSHGDEVCPRCRRPCCTGCSRPPREGPCYQRRLSVPLH